MTELLTKNKKRKGEKKHGFLGRIKSASGKKVIQRRRQKGRKNV